MRALLIICLMLLASWPPLTGQEVITARRRAVSGGTGPVFASSVHNQCVVLSGTPSCAITAAGGEKVFILATDLTSANTISSITASSGATPTLCSGYPVAWAGGSLNAYLYQVSIASAGTITYTTNWSSSVSFASISILSATNVTTINCASTTSNTGSLSSTANQAGASFTNTAHALVLCFISPGTNSPTTSSGSTFTMTAVDTGGGTYAVPVDGQGSIASAGTNNCSWNVAPATPTDWIQSAVVLQ